MMLALEFVGRVIIIQAYLQIKPTQLMFTRPTSVICFGILRLGGILSIIETRY